MGKKKHHLVIKDEKDNIILKVISNNAASLRFIRKDSGTFIDTETEEDYFKHVYVLMIHDR